MVKILKKSYETPYYQKCNTCGTEFTYQRMDVKSRLVPYSDVVRYYIQCPECFRKMPATFEEYADERMSDVC